MSSPTWNSDELPQHKAPGALGWVLIAVRALLIIFCMVLGMLVLLSLRLIERPVFGMHRPVSPFVTQIVCRVSLWILGLRLVTQGRPMKGQGAIVANHTSWLDILVLNASDRVYFVSKAEVERWPGIGWLAKATGTLFITRDRSHAKDHANMFIHRLQAPHRLLFFPEGTSTDGQQVLAFKPTLFAAFYEPDLINETQIQPVSVVYHAPTGADARFYGWWGDMGFGEHLLSTLAAVRHGYVEVIYHPPIAVKDTQSRKHLAALAEQAVRAGHAAARS